MENPSPKFSLNEYNISGRRQFLHFSPTTSFGKEVPSMVEFDDIGYESATRF